MKTVNRLDYKRKLSQIDAFDKNRVTGRLRICYQNKNGDYKMQFIPFIENRKYIFKEGIYKIVYEYSPKFKRKLWELKGIEGRSEIKIHNGRNPEHSRGCLVTRSQGLEILHNILDASKEYYINIENN